MYVCVCTAFIDKLIAKKIFKNCVIEFKKVEKTMFITVLRDLSTLLWIKRYEQKICWTKEWNQMLYSERTLLEIS